MNLIRVWKNMYAAYVWMLQFHPDVDYGMKFVLSSHHTRPADLESEYRRWRNAIT